jgi:integrase/recombinase XerC
MLLPDAITTFVAYLRFEKRFSDHTVLAYENDLAQFSDFIKGQFEVLAVHDVESMYVRTWLANLKDGKIAPRSINRKLSSLKSFFKFMMRNGTIAASPVSTLSGPKAGKKLPVWVPGEQLEGLTDRSVFEEGIAGDSAWLVMQLLYETGLRRSELVALREDQIDRHSNTIRVLGKGKKERILPVRAGLMEAVQHYLAEKRNTSFAGPTLLVQGSGQPINVAWVYKTVKKYLGLITTQQKRSPHVLRHSFATQLTNAGADLNAVKELLGHASLAATQVYTHNSIEKLKKVHGQAHPKG